MIILITGASHTGKTFLAQRLLEEKQFPYLSIDHLKMGLIRSGNTNLTPENDNELTLYLWPIVREIVKTAIENKQNLIVEGCYIPPKWREDFNEDYLKNIRFICLAMTDAYIDAHINDIKNYASTIEARLCDTDCAIDSLKADNHYYIDAFSVSGEQVVLIDNDFSKSIETILQQ